jgi:hypothetical protein
MKPAAVPGRRLFHVRAAEPTLLASGELELHSEPGHLSELQIGDGSDA